jgi:hypothetical protein
MKGFEEVKEKAMKTRKAFQAGEISYKEAKEQLADFKELYNQKAEEIGAKYNVQPKRFKFSDFLKFKI